MLNHLFSITYFIDISPVMLNHPVPPTPGCPLTHLEQPLHTLFGNPSIVLLNVIFLVVVKDFLLTSIYIKISFFHERAKAQSVPSTGIWRLVC